MVVDDAFVLDAAACFLLSKVVFVNSSQMDKTKFCEHLSS
jgi:hypothetical protein